MDIWFNHVRQAPLADEAVAALETVIERWRAAPEGAGSAAVRRDVLERARAQIAALLAADPADVVLTSSGTEAANLALKGTVRAAGRKGRLLASAVEHSSVLYPLRTLAREGHSLTLLPVDRAGRVDPEDVERELGGGALLLSVQHANHEVGTLQPIEELALRARRHGVPLHVDAVASAGLAALDVSRLGVDLVSLSASSLGAPPGAGALWIRPGVRVLPLLEGGTEEGGRRGGGENLLGLAAMGAAAEAVRGREPQRWRSAAVARDRLESGLRRAAGAMEVNGPAAEGRLPGHLHASFAGAEGEALVVRLARAGVHVSTGSACSGEAGKPSHVLTAMGLGPERARCSVLFSLGPGTTLRQVDRALEVVPGAVRALRAIGQTG